MFSTHVDGSVTSLLWPFELVNIINKRQQVWLQLTGSEILWVSTTSVLLDFVGLDAVCVTYSHEYSQGPTSSHRIGVYVGIYTSRTIS